MRNFTRNIWLAATVVAIGFAGCTKKKEIPVGADGKPMITPFAEPEKVVVETEVSVPKEMLKTVKRTDLMIWDLRDAEGVLLAGNIQPVPKFPYKISVVAKDLRKEIPQTATLLFNARIVKFGEEHQPPRKGQLVVSVGTAGGGEEVVNPNVDQKRLDAWMKKNHFVPLQQLSIGDKVKADFSPIFF